MAKMVCGWCGKKIPFTDTQYDFKRIKTNEYFICSKCLEKISEYEKGKVSLSEIVTENTQKELLFSFKNLEDGSCNSQPEATMKQMSFNIGEGKDEPLYEEIHKISNDLHFIKNYLVVSICLEILSAIILLLVSIF